jgi:hypothetical protein
MGRKPRKPAQDIPDSLPSRDEGTDVLPDDVRRSDKPDRTPPDSPPPEKEEEERV